MSVQLGPFRLERPLGRGGAAVVWRGEHIGQRVPVAIKVMPPRAGEEDVLRTFKNEVYAVAQLAHPHIVRVLDHGAVSEDAAERSGHRLRAGSPYLVMELATGLSLDRISTPMSWPTVFETLWAMLDGLAHAHARGVVHRDIKPANILICLPGDLRPGLKLTDFGLAHRVSPEAGDEEAIHGGTPQYMAPEQFRRGSRDVGPASDLYALGCVAYWMITGAFPYDAEGWKPLKRLHKRGPLPVLPKGARSPPGFEAWLHRLLQKDPLARFSCAADAAWALRQLEPGRPIPPFNRLPEGIRPEEATLASDNAFEATSSAGDATRVKPSASVGISQLPTLNLGSPEVFTSVRVVDGRPPVPGTWRGPPPEPLDARLAGAGLGLYGLRTVPFVGRDEQRDQLWSALRRVDDGGAEAVVLKGPSGVGKSRLAEWLCGRASELGAASVLRATFAERPGPAEGLGRAVARELRLWDLEPAEAQLRAARWCEARRSEGLDPEDLVALSGLYEGSTRFASAEERYIAMIRFLRAASERRPAILWLDDVQWSAEPIELAEAVLRQREELRTRVIVLLTANEVDLAGRPEAEAVSRLLSAEHASEIAVGPLSDHDHRALIAQLLGLEGTLAEQLRVRTAGNPLFAVHVVSDWVEQGVLVPGPQGFTLAQAEGAPLPDALHELWSPRLLRVVDGQAEQVAIEQAAVLGADVEDLEWREACAAAGVPPADGALERLIERGLLRRRPAGFAFAHAMIRSSAERMAADAGRLKRLHLCAAEALRSLYGHDALGITGRVGQHLLAGGQPDEALEPLLSGAATLADEGQLIGAQSLLQAWRAAADQLTLAPTDARRLSGEILEARLLDVTGQHQVAAEAAKRWMAFALEAREHGLVAQAALVRADAKATVGQLDESAKLYRRARRSAEKVGDEVLLGKATLGLGHVEYYQGKRARSRERYKRAYALFERLGRPRELATSLWSLGFVEMWRGRPDTAEALFKRMLQLAQAERDRRTEADAENALGELARREDDLGAAREHYQAAVRLARASGYAKHRIFRLNLAHTELGCGEIEVAERTVETVGDELERAQDSIGASTARWIRAICAAERGDFVAFKEHREHAMALLGENSPVDDDVASSAEHAAEVAKRRGEYEESVPVYAFARALWERLGHDERMRACDEALAKMGHQAQGDVSPDEATRLKAGPKT